MSKKILGFDVGIKNLAYCTIIADSTQYKIESWGIINLDDDRKVCQYMLRTQKECGKTAVCSYHNKDTNKESYLCKLHENKYEPESHLLEDIENIKDNKLLCCYKEEKEEKEENKKTEIECQKKSSCKLLDKYYCKSHGKQELKRLEKETKVKKISSQSCGKLPIITLTKKLCEKLDQHSDFLQVDEVLIENQPSMLNPKMKTISSILYSYFMINGIGNVAKNKSTISNVKFNAPSNKLKVNKEGTAKILGISKNKKEEYEYTKELGVLYCRELIKEDKIHLDYLNSEIKQDDLCDAFLHGFQYYYNGKKLLDDKKSDLDKVVETMYQNICSKHNYKPEDITEIKKSKKTTNKIINLDENKLENELDEKKKKYKPFFFKKKKKGIKLTL